MSEIVFRHASSGRGNEPLVIQEPVDKTIQFSMITQQLMEEYEGLNFSIT